jgi:hypothetical protein
MLATTRMLATQGTRTVVLVDHAGAVSECHEPAIVRVVVIY